MTAPIEPARYCPCPPMLKRPQRNANATARPVRASAVQRMNVCCRFAAARDSTSFVSQGNQMLVSVKGMPMSWLPISKNHERPDPRKIAR
jgi:hypothetical protein